MSHSQKKLTAIAEFFLWGAPWTGATLLVAVGAVIAKPQAAAEDAYDATVTPAGEWLATFLDRMDVEHHWLPGHEHVAWKSGLQLREEHGKKLTPLAQDETHCSAFAAAAADELGIYLLHPPEHSHVLLANAQYDWLASAEGRKAGWAPLDSPLAAQRAANSGALVVAVFKNFDPAKPGHIAIVRPSDETAAEIMAKGPQIIQAGFNNYRSADLQIGFDRHQGAWEPGGGGAVKFYAHAVEGDKLAGE